MNEEQILRKLTEAARGDAPPLIDVSGRVVARLAIPSGGRNVLLWAFTAVCSAAAAALIVVSSLASATQEDPVGDYIESVMGMMQ